MEVGMPRLETLWRLEVGIHLLPMVRLAGVYRLCWRGRCAEVEVATRGRVCESEECRRFLEERLNGRWATVVAEVSPAVWKPEFKVSGGPPELREIMEKVEPLPGCWYSRELNYQTDSIKRVLEGAPGIENPKEWWAVHVADGALVVLLIPKVLVICLRPECDRSRCREVLPLGEKNVAWALVDNAELLAQLAQNDPEALLGFLSTVLPSTSR